MKKTSRMQIVNCERGGGGKTASKPTIGQRVRDFVNRLRGR